MTIAAIYKNGVFVPTEKVELPEHALVRVEPVADHSDSVAALRERGWGRGGVLRVADDFDATPPGFEEHTG